MAGCTAAKKNDSTAAPELNLVASQEAINLFTEGQLAEMSNNYQAALQKYYKALLLDSSNTVVLNAIGNAHIKMEKYSNALLYLKRSSHLDPQNVETWTLLGEAFLGLQNFDSAAEAFESAIHLQPRNMNLRRYLIYIYSNTRNNRKLLEQYLSILRVIGFDPDVALKAADLLLQENKVTEASELYTRILQANPQNVSAIIGLAQIDMFKGDTAKAEERYREAMKIQPENPDVDFNYSRLLRQQRDWDGLINLYKAKLNADSTDNMARVNVAEGYYWKKDYQKAREILKPYYGIEGLHPGIAQLIGKVETGLKNYDTAEKYFRDAFAVSSDDPSLFLDLSYCYDMNKKPDSAVAVLKKATEIFPQEIVFWRYLGQIYAQKKDYPNAINAVEHSLKLEANDLASLSILANLYNETGQYAKSDSVYEKALVISPDDPLVNNNYAYGLAERDTLLIRAHQMSQKAVRAEPENSSYLDTIAWILYKLGRIDEAKEKILLAIKYDTDKTSAEIYIHAGYIFKDSEPKRALKYFKTALERDPESRKAREGIKLLEGN
jgi:tetratricopeptide (TPR) repeat protein